VARDLGEEWEDEGPEVAAAARAKMQEVRQRRFADEGGDWDEAVPWVR
jgi:hypothetical protein